MTKERKLGLRDTLSMNHDCREARNKSKQKITWQVTLEGSRSVNDGKSKTIHVIVVLLLSAVLACSVILASVLS